jgi:hypothetical protein
MKPMLSVRSFFSTLLAPLATALGTSACALALASLSFLKPENSFWFLTASGVWFVGGAAGLAVATRNAERYRSIVAYACGLAPAALSLGALSASDPLWQFVDGVAEYYPAIALWLYQAAASWTLGSVGTLMTTFSIAAYACAPHIAATAAIVLARTDRSGPTAAIRIALVVSGLAVVAWGSLALPRAAFGARPLGGGTLFCQRAEDCSSHPFFDGFCYSVPPARVSDYLVEPVFGVRCKCVYSRCRELPPRKSPSLH